MRIVLVTLLAACGSSDPSCRDAITKAVGSASDRPEAALAIGTCEQHAWSGAVRSCVAKGKDLAACMPVEKPATPAIVASPETLAIAKKASAIKAIYFGAKPDVVAAYVKQLGLAFEVVDRFADPKRSETYRVLDDGTLVFEREGKFEKIVIREDERSEYTLPKLDFEAANALFKLARTQRHAYVYPPRDVAKRVASLSSAIEMLNFKKHDLVDGEVPRDASVVFVLDAPPDGGAAIAAYLARGGAAFVAMDPKTSLPALEAVLGVKLAPGTLVDDARFLPQRGSPGDHALVVTNGFAAHASITSLSKTVDKGVLFANAGAFVDVEANAKRKVVIESGPKSWLDLDGDYAFDDGAEKRGVYALAEAIEGDKWRAFAVTSVTLVADVLVRNATGTTSVTMPGGPLATDAVRWLVPDEFVALPEAPPTPKPREKSIAERDAALLKRLEKP